MVEDIINYCIKKGFFLDKDMLFLFKNMEENKKKQILDILSSINLKEKVITKKILLKNRDKIEPVLNKKNIKFQDIIEINYTDIIDIEKNGLDEEIKILNEPIFEQKILEINDFLNYFRLKYNFIKDKFDINNIGDITSIRKIPKSGSFSAIVSVFDKKITKNKNILLSVEDLTGNINVIINKDNTNIYNKASKLFLDDIILIKCNIINGDLFIVNDIIFSELKLDKEKKIDEDIWIAFIGDLHCGSKYFLESNFLKFIKWINKEDPNEYENIAKKIKYLFIGGDLIEGIGEYSLQEEDLSIKKIKLQYKKVEELLKLFRKDLKIFLSPGNRDALWKGEPQKKINIEYFENIKKNENIIFLTNPSNVLIKNTFNILSYHGMNIYNLINQRDDIKNKFGYKSPNNLIKELFNSYQLCPSYGNVDVVIDNNNSMVIKTVPDIIFTSHFHRCDVDVKNNILMINGSCWVKNTKYSEEKGIIPNYCKVSLFNLKTREIKILDFE